MKKHLRNIVLLSTIASANLFAAVTNDIVVYGGSSAGGEQIEKRFFDG